MIECSLELSSIIIKGENMKFTKHQKETIKHIYTGEIYDIISYLKYFNLGTTIKFDKNKIINSFASDEIPKKYYCHNSLPKKHSNIITETEFAKKLANNEVNPDNYTSYNLQLSYNTGTKHELWEGQTYTLDFYHGIYVANSFDNILEFLTLWQFLISEMLIIEVPHDLSADILGLFYRKESTTIPEDTSINERIKKINIENFSYDDQYYLYDNNYTLSYEHCFMCKEYMDKRIYPSTKLGVFINKHFKTYEENTQNRALFVAWLAVFVSITLTFAPYFQPKDNSDIESITENLKNIKSSIEEKELSEELSIKMDIIIEKLDILSNKISSEKINSKISEISTPSEQ